MHASHCLIVKCGGTYKQQTVTNSRTRKVDKKVLEEQYLCTFGTELGISKKNYFHFQNATKNGNTVGTILYIKKKYKTEEKRIVISAFEIVQTLLPFFVKF